MSAISVFQVKFNVEFTRQAVNFSIVYACFVMFSRSMACFMHEVT